MSEVEFPSTKEELVARHKKEAKDLIATITGLKKQATKKTRKNVMSKCQELQDQLDKKQKEELASFDQDNVNVDDKGAVNDDSITPESLLAQLDLQKVSQEPSSSEVNVTPQQTKGKRNRQKERLEKRKHEIERIKEEARAEAANTIDYRQIEIDSMNQVLALNDLQLHEIRPDGHCLFASIQDQLLIRHQEEKSVQELRELAADYISKHRDDFIPFLFDEKTMELRDMDSYLEELTTTAMWGSDMEILALGKSFDCPISIYIAGAATMTINEDGAEPKLRLGYYKHTYGLGEHYNSLRDIVVDEQEIEDEDAN
ncbi:hypothetical protein DFJ63DRAFT_99567 [Scheffersomyces coipomensis]|uniref:uncharacterized protein n=1 Tax=Scheffersomyces coipomensis TaxID=1788519 RepID=UPI00315D8784